MYFPLFIPRATVPPMLSNYMTFPEWFKSMDSEATLSGSESRLCLLLVAWASYLTSLCLSFLIYKMGMKIEPPSEGCEDSIINMRQVGLTAPVLRTNTR